MQEETSTEKDSAAYLYGKVAWIYVGIETRRHRIIGKLVQYEGSRFSDALNRQKDFIVLCDARVSPLDGVEDAREYEALMVGKDKITLAWEELTTRS